MYGFTSFAEVPFAALNSVVGSVNEAIVLTDLQTGAFQYNVTTDESISFSASQQAATAFGEVSVVESIGIYDYQNVTAQFAASVAESLGLSADQNVTAVFVGATEETIDLTANEVGYFTFNVTTQESIGLTDSENVLVVFVGDVAETIAMTESASGRADFVASVTESLNLTASQCAFGWFGINDDQTPSWGLITINVNEVATYGAFTFGGVPFAGTLTVSGVVVNPIPDEQDPNWTEAADTGGTGWSEINNNQNC